MNQFILDIYRHYTMSSFVYIKVMSGDIIPLIDNLSLIPSGSLSGYLTNANFVVGQRANSLSVQEFRSLMLSRSSVHVQVKSDAAQHQRLMWLQRLHMR